MIASKNKSLFGSITYVFKMLSTTSKLLKVYVTIT